MPVIYFTYYTPASKSIPAITNLEHTLGRKLLRMGLEQIYHLFFTAESLDCAMTAAEYGKPCLKEHPEIHFNISHCTGLAACAFHSQPVGIDAELPGYFAKVLINKALSFKEKAFLQKTGITPSLEQEWFYRFWTLKEAYVKLSGTGVDTALTDFSFTFSDVLEKNGNFSVRCSDTGISCYQTKLPNGQIVSLCCPGCMDEVSFVECKIIS